MRLFILLCLLLWTSPGYAATLLWDSQPSTGPLTVERSPAATGPYAVLATVPAGTLTYVLTPGAYGWYRIGSAAGPSNVVQFSLDLYTGGLEDRVTALEAQVAALSVPVVVTPPVTGPLTSRLLDATHLEITCIGASMRTTGSGLRRVVECVP